MKEIFESSKGSYGAHRLSRALRTDIGRHKAARLMKKNVLEVRKAKKFKATTNSKHKYPVADNLLDRGFCLPSPNKAWVVDITYLWTREGWLYLAAVMDLYSRKIVGWAMSSRMTTELPLQAFQMAYWARKPGKGLLHHSDQGSQYASHDYQAELKSSVWCAA